MPNAKVSASREMEREKVTKQIALKSGKVSVTNNGIP